jgi:hypothetical protein
MSKREHKAKQSKANETPPNLSHPHLASCAGLDALRLPSPVGDQATRYTLRRARAVADEEDDDEADAALLPMSAATQLSVPDAPAADHTRTVPSSDPDARSDLE